MLRNWGWIHWTVLVGYYAAIFLLCNGSASLAIVLSFLPFLITSLIIRCVHKDMVDYLADNHAEEWSEIAREWSYPHLTRRSLLSFDGGIDDPDYEKLRKEYKSVCGAFLLSCFACIAAFIYF